MQRSGGSLRLGSSKGSSTASRRAARVLDCLLASAGDFIYGERAAPCFSERNRALMRRKIDSCLTEAIHFGNDVHPSVASSHALDALRRNGWMLSDRNDWWDSSEYASASRKNYPQWSIA